jgi:adenylate kinase
MQQKPFKIFVVLGRSGSGKGTQVEMLQKKIKGIYHIETGALLRDLSREKNSLGQKVKMTLNRGELVPYSFVAYLWTKELLRVFSQKKRWQGVVFEGSPRKLVEAKMMDQAIHFIFGIQPIAIYIEVSQAEARQRLLKRLVCSKCGQPVPYRLLTTSITRCPSCQAKLSRRSDDTPQAIKERLEFFRRNVLPCLRHYQKDKRLIWVNGEQSSEKVFQEMWKKLKTNNLV